MKRKTFVLLILIVTTFSVFNSCKVTKHQPALYGRWKMVKHFTAGADDSERYFQTYEVYAFEFNKDGTYFEYYSFVGLINSAKGNYRIVDKNILALTDLINPANSRSFKILELKKDVFRFQWSDTELIMVPIPEGEKIFPF